MPKIAIVLFVALVASMANASPVQTSLPQETETTPQYEEFESVFTAEDIIKAQSCLNEVNVNKCIIDTVFGGDTTKYRNMILKEFDGIFKLANEPNSFLNDSEDSGIDKVKACENKDDKYRCMIDTFFGLDSIEAEVLNYHE